MLLLFAFLLRVMIVVRSMHLEKFPNMRLKPWVVCRFDTGPTFIDTDEPMCHLHNNIIKVSMFGVLRFKH